MEFLTGLGLKASGTVFGVDVAIDTSGGKTGGHTSGGSKPVVSNAPGLIAGVSTTMILAAAGLYFLAKS